MGDLLSIPGLGRSPGEGNGPLQYSGLENSMDRGTWQVTVHWVTKSWTRISDFHFHLLAYYLILTGFLEAQVQCELVAPWLPKVGLEKASPGPIAKGVEGSPTHRFVQ